MIRKRKVVRCIETNEVFASIQEAARVKGMSASNLCAYLKYGMNGRRGGYHWEIIEEQNVPARVKCVETGEMFDTQKEAADKFNIGRSSVGWSIRTGRPICGHTFIKVDE